MGDTKKDLNYYGIMSTAVLRRVKPNCSSNTIFLNKICDYKGKGEVLDAVASFDSSLNLQQHSVAIDAWQTEIKSKKDKLDGIVAEAGSDFRLWTVENSVYWRKIEDLDKLYKDATAAKNVKKRKADSDALEARNDLLMRLLDDLIAAALDGNQEKINHLKIMIMET